MKTLIHAAILLLAFFSFFSCGIARYSEKDVSYYLENRIMTPEMIDSLLRGAPRPFYSSSEKAVESLYTVVPQALLKRVTQSKVKNKTWQMMLGNELSPIFVTFSKHNTMIVEGVSEDSILQEELEYYLSDNPDLQFDPRQKNNKEGRFLIYHQREAPSNKVGIVFFYNADQHHAEISFVETPFNGTIMIASRRPEHRNKIIKNNGYNEYPQGTVFIR